MTFNFKNIFSVLQGGCSARVVTVPPGPLIRVEGQPVSIRCDVKEYTGPNEQVILPTRISDDACRFSTSSVCATDHHIQYKRVASGDISVVRLQDNEVELKIAEVKSQDAGFYECQTPSTDYVISGNYAAKVQLTVISNTLKVSPKTPPPVIPEGSDLTLSCNVTRELVHPTYLSVTWSVKKGTASEEILTFGPQGDVVTGPRFARRYADGGIRLVPGRNGLFELVISRMTTSDEGNYECNGTEWTHESGGQWIKIVESTKEMGTVAVTPTTTSSSPSSTSLVLTPGNSLTLMCYVAADNLPALSLEVTWLADGREIITMERSGVVITNTSSSGAQGKRGEASLERTGAGEYRLGVGKVSGEDGGEYTCRIRAFIEKGGRRWHMTTEKTSNPVAVKVSEITQLNPQTTAEPTELACRVTNITNLPPGGRLGISWEHTSLPGMFDSTLLQRSFSYRITRFLNCSDLRQRVLVFPGPTVNVVAKRIREASVGGSTFEMSCSVSTTNIGEAGYSVLIQSQDSLESTVRTIMTLSPDNVVQHGGATDPNRRDNLVLTKSGPAEFRFRLAGVQLSDRGYYWCDITAWTKQQPGQAWTKASSSESNKLQINFQENGPSFSIAIHSDDSTWLKFVCVCVSLLDEVAYEVKWFFTRLRGGHTLTQVANVDRFGVVRKINRNSSSDVTIERSDTHTYLLNIFGTQDSDSGEYYCVVTPWYLSASTGAWTEAGELTSSRIFLTVKFAVLVTWCLFCFFEPCVFPGVGLFSLVLGLVCAQCCCRNTAHLPRSRNKLMDLEMD
uniref:Ig-like domain-containing protein n=1 Tax=Amphilophus citrinellus TaxID=61819 RepID=A0A3Q0S3Q6_AMPCI